MQPNTQQVAQVWQRDRTKLDTFSIKIQRYFKIMHKIGFLAHPMGYQGQYMRFI